MVRIVGIQLQKNGKIIYYDANGLDLKPGDYIVADTAKGLDLGEVVVGIRETEEENASAQIRKVVRAATRQDIDHSAENRVKEKEAYRICQKKIEEHQLDMKLVSVEYAFDNSKILFYFTANGRVDFRSLVKDLASVFKMRIELRQIGVRDEAKMLGGLGPCGRQICCGAFLDEFQPVSIKMAKEQNLSLNPTKISGVCGRLMCCLKYEQDHYEQTRKRMPKVGKEVITPAGTGVVSDLNIVKETVSVRITNGDSSEIKEFPIEDITRAQNNPVSEKQPDIEQEVKDDGIPARETNTVHSPASGQRTKPAENAGNRQDGRERRKNRNPEKNTGAHGKKQSDKKTNRNAEQLGKPVKRENPNRESRDHHESVKKEPPAVKSGEWADALKKAMDAIG